MASAGAVKTRHNSGSGSLSEYLGGGTPLLPSELPTLRAALRQGLFYKEERMLQEDSSKKGRSYSYPMSELVQDMTTAVIEQFLRANKEFQPPVVVSERGIQIKLKTAWETAQKIAIKHFTKKSKIKAFEDKLDKLLDITKCRCSIKLCHDFGCPENCRRCSKCARCGTCKQCKECEECAQGAHISCSCPRAEKIPLLELRFILAQRDKIGEKGAMMMATSVDMKEQKKKEKQDSRKGLEITRVESKKEKEKEEQQELETRKVEEQDNEEDDETLQEIDTLQETEVVYRHLEASGAIQDSVAECLKNRNMMDVSGLASTAIRYGVSSRGAAACGTAFLGDLIRSGVLPTSAASLAVDGAKLQRAKDKVMEAARERGEEELELETPKCLLFDSRIDKKTRVMKYDDETKKQYPRIEPEDHYTITDGEGTYLHHFTKPGKVKEDEESGDEGPVETENDEMDVGEERRDQEHDNGGAEGRQEADQEELSYTREELDKLPAEVVARIMLTWILEHGVEKTLTHLGADSTTSNTGWRKGIIAWLEKLLGRKFHWLICMLHTNELGLRQLVAKLDGKTNSKTGFSGPLGKMLPEVNNMEPKLDFKKIDIGPEDEELTDEVVKDLSKDQKMLYQRWRAVKTGKLSRDVAICQSGNIVHSRWLTTAEAFLKMYQSKHGLEGELLKRLETIVTYISSVYCYMWFRIKSKHSWLEGPRHILTELGLFKLQSPEVQEILLPTLRRSAWHSHSEAVLQSMVCSQDREEREFAVSAILKIRGRNKLGNTKPRPMKLPELNVDATELKDMISWKKAKEPLLTCSLAKEEIKSIKEEPMKVPYHCLHTQGIERAVKETTNAAGSVFGFERRDGYIRGRIENISLMPALNSKKCLENLLK